MLPPAGEGERAARKRAKRADRGGDGGVEGIEGGGQNVPDQCKEGKSGHEVCPHIKKTQIFLILVLHDQRKQR